MIVEGGSKLLQNFIDSNNWDEIRIIKNKKINILSGVKSPKLYTKTENKIEKELTVIANNQLINKIEKTFTKRF